MKPLLLAIVLLMSWPSHAGAADWIWVEEAANGNRIYLDRDSVQRQGAVVRYWDSLKRTTPDAEGAWSNRMYRAADCRTNRVRIYRSLKYNATGQLIQTKDFGKRGFILEAQPGSLVYAVVRYVCDGDR